MQKVVEIPAVTSEAMQHGRHTVRVELEHCFAFESPPGGGAIEIAGNNLIGGNAPSVPPARLRPINHSRLPVGVPGVALLSSRLDRKDVQLAEILLRHLLMAN